MKHICMIFLLSIPFSCYSMEIETGMICTKPYSISDDILTVKSDNNHHTITVQTPMRRNRFTKPITVETSKRNKHLILIDWVIKYEADNPQVTNIDAEKIRRMDYCDANPYNAFYVYVADRYHQKFSRIQHSFLVPEFNSLPTQGVLCLAACAKKVDKLDTLLRERKKQIHYIGYRETAKKFTASLHELKNSASRIQQHLSHKEIHEIFLPQLKNKIKEFEEEEVFARKILATSAIRVNLNSAKID